MGEYLKEQYEKVDNEKLFERIRKDVKRCYKEAKFRFPPESNVTLMKYQHFYALEHGFKSWKHLRDFYLGKEEDK